jgi:hypothetical protein
MPLPSKTTGLAPQSVPLLKGWREMDAHEILIAARKLIEKPENWTQETSARDAAGRETLPTSPRAVCWCASGAILRAGRADAGNALFALRSVGNIAHFNDTHTHPEVLALLDKAIEATAPAEVG